MRSLKISAHGADESKAVLVGGSPRDLGDVTDYLDDIEAFRELAMSGSGRVAFDPSALERTISRSDPARFMDGPVADSLRRACALAAALAGAAGKPAYAEVVA